MTVLIAALILVQSLQPQWVYTLDHPINPDWLVLATDQGRYAVTRLSANCDWLRGDMNVHLDQQQDSVAYLSDGQTNGCVIGVLGLIDQTPCFTNAEGFCDVAIEDQW